MAKQATLPKPIQTRGRTSLSPPLGDDARSPPSLMPSLGVHTNWHSTSVSPTLSLLDQATPPKRSRRRKSNSTNNIFLDSSISAPDTRDIVKCIAHTIHCATQIGANNPSSVHDELWSEEYHSLDGNQEAWKKVPSEETIEDFLLHIFCHTVMCSETCVMALVYMDRLLELSAVTLQPKNWRRLLLGALIVASKVFEDDAVWNEDFLQPFPAMKISDLGDLERCYLNGLQFSVTLKPSVYAEYYFRLIGLSTKQNFEPLNDETVQRLYARSKGYEMATTSASRKRRKSAQRTQSLDASPGLGRKGIQISAEQLHFPKMSDEALVEYEEGL